MNQSTIFRRIFTGIGRGASTLVKRTWKIALTLVLILAVAHGVATFVTGRMVDAEIAKIKAKGEIASPAEIAGPKVPDDENAAVVYARAFKLMKGKGAASAWKTIGRLLDGQPEPWDRVSKAVRRFDGLMPLIEQGVARPKSQFPVRWQDGPATLYVHLADLRQLQRYLAARAVLEAHDRSMTEALRLVRLQLDLSESQREEPGIIAQLVRVAMIGIAYDSLRQCLKRGPVDPQQARQLRAALSAIDLVPGFSRALEAERIAMGTAGFDYFIEDPEAFGVILGAPTPWDNPVWQMCEKSFLGRPFINVDQVVYFRKMAKIVANSRRPYRELEREWGPTFHGMGQPSYAPVTGLMTGTTARVIEARDRSEARIALAQVALGLCLYRQSYGQYPTSLDSLKTRLDWPLPKDPFSGKQLVYRRQGDSFLLYSIGWDLKDNGGKVSEDRKAFDIVW